MLSIIIPCYNQHELTAECLKAIKENTYGEYEVILVDNGSEPPIVAYRPDLMRGIKVFRNNSNLGFPVAVNQGIREATGDAIILLNNDCIVTPCWDVPLVSNLDRYAITGPLTNYCAGLQRATISVYNDTEELNKAALKWANSHEGETEEVNYVIGFCMAFRKSLFEEIGRFDESLWPCSGEELNFCFQAREKGYKIGICRDVYVHHEGSQTFKIMDVNYAEICRRNDEHLANRWGRDFWFKQSDLTMFEKRGEKVKINLGCGRFKLKGFVNIDKNPNVEPDIVSDTVPYNVYPPVSAGPATPTTIYPLPYEPDSVDVIYCGHMLEHLTYDEGQKALKYWHSLLKKDGKIYVVVPDFDWFVRDYFVKRNCAASVLKSLNDEIIYSYIQESHHKYCYNEELLTVAMKDAGFRSLTRMPLKHPYYVDGVEWQVGVEGIK